VPYPDKLLTPDERVVEHLRPHWKKLVLPVLVLLVVAAVSGYGLGVVASPVLRIVIAALALVVLVTLVVAPVLRWRSTHVVLTDRRVMLRHGILTRTGRDVPLARINDISSAHSLLDRMLGCGTLTVESAGERGRLVLADLPHVERVQAAMYELVEGGAPSSDDRSDHHDLDDPDDDGPDDDDPDDDDPDDDKAYDDNLYDDEQAYDPGQGHVRHVLYDHLHPAAAEPERDQVYDYEQDAGRRR